MSDHPSLSPLTANEARQIDQICDRFEAAWKAGQRPRLEEYLGGHAEPARSALLRQLLFLDWDYRRRAGEAPRSSDYHPRCLGDLALIEDVCHEVSNAPNSTQTLGDGEKGRDTPWSGASATALGGQVDAGFPSGAERYEMLEEVGHGGIGVVFRGRDRHLGRELAIKVLRESYRDTPAARRRFLEEARVGSRLQHPAIVPVYDLGWFSDRRPYLTMKLVEGRTLAALLHERTDPSRDLLRWLAIFEQVCQAMAYAHAKGVVHRDLKPANIMVGAFGEVQVMDWGFAKQLQREEASAGQTATPGPRSSDELPAAVRTLERGSQSGVLMGTPAYMPPEQARGEVGHIDARADVFALGAVLCEVLTGQPPYAEGSFAEVYHRSTEGNLSHAHQRLDACGAAEALRELAKRCLAAERQARPQDAGVVARDLAAFLAAEQERMRQAQLERAAAAARAKEAVARERAQRRARWLTVALAVAASILVASASAAWWWQERVQQAQVVHVAITDSKVEAAMTEADGHLQRNDWAQATAAVRRANELQESGASDHWKQQVDEARADLKLIAQLDELYFHRATSDWSSWRDRQRVPLSEFAEAFAQYGIRAGANPSEVAARLAPRPAPVRDAITGGLENWWLSAQGRDAAACEWLGAVLQALDDDEWRTQVRRAVVRGDRGLLEELAAKEEVARQPKATLFALAEALFDLKAYEAAIALLRPAQQRFPNDFWINLDLGDALVQAHPSNPTEALRYYSIAHALRPEASIYVNLGFLLIKQNDWDGVIFVSQQAVAQHPDSAEAHNNLGVGLERKGEWQQAQAQYRKAIQLKPDLANPHYNLALSLEQHGEAEQAISEFERTIELYPTAANAYFALGNIRVRRQELDAALAAFDKSLAIQSDYAPTHNARGSIFLDKGQLDEAVAAFEKAIQFDPKLDMAHSNLGKALLHQSRVDRAQGRPELAQKRLQRAVAAFSRAVELNPRSATNHYNLAAARQSVSDLEGAVAAYREAIRLDPNHAEAHCNLQQLLTEQGQFTEALAEIEKGHRLGSARPDWHYPSANWLKAAQRLVEMDAKLPGVVDGSVKPATVREAIEYASICKRKGKYADAARLYADAFTAEPRLAATYRFQAACVAALAGTGQGDDGPRPESDDGGRLRKQALDWLRAELVRRAEELDKAANGRAAAKSALQGWRRDNDLAGVRDPEQLARLPESERAGYLRFWAEVDELLVRCLASPAQK